MKKIIVILTMIIIIILILYSAIPVKNIKNVDYVLKNQNDSTYFVTVKLDYEIKVNRNILNYDDVRIVLNFNNVLWYLRNSLDNDISVKYSNRPYSIDNHTIDNNGDSIITMWGYLSKDLEKMFIAVKYDDVVYSLYIPAVDENDIKTIQRNFY